LEGVAVCVRDDELLLVEGAMRVRPVVADDVPDEDTEGERRLPVVPSVYRGEEELRPLLTEEELELEEFLLVVLPFREDERPDDE
jgi:hypothetical protein